MSDKIGSNSLPAATPEEMSEAGFYEVLFMRLEDNDNNKTDWDEGWVIRYGKLVDGRYTVRHADYEFDITLSGTEITLHLARYKAGECEDVFLGVSEDGEQIPLSQLVGDRNTWNMTSCTFQVRPELVGNDDYVVAIVPNYDRNPTVLAVAYLDSPPVDDEYTITTLIATSGLEAVKTKK